MYRCGLSDSTILDQTIVSRLITITTQYSVITHAKILGVFRIQVLADFGMGDNRLVEAMIWSNIVPELL